MPCESSPSVRSGVVRAGKPVLFVALLLVGLLAGIDPVTAQLPVGTPLTPSTVTIVKVFQQPFQSDGNDVDCVTYRPQWRISEDDNGTFNYSVKVTLVDGNFGTTSFFGFNGTPDRFSSTLGASDTWARVTGSGPDGEPNALDACVTRLADDGVKPQIKIRVSAWNTTTSPPVQSGESCEVRILTGPDGTVSGVSDSWPSDAHGDQCGQQLEAPRGLAGLVVVPRTETNNAATLNFSVPVSASDPNQATGDLDLWLFRSLETSPTLFFPYPIHLRRDLVASTFDIVIDPPDVAFGGVYSVERQVSGERVGLWPLVRDPLTNEQSDIGCAITMDTNTLFAQDRCGTVAPVGVSFDPGIPQFPAVNLANQSEQLNITLEKFTWMFGVGLVFGASLFGFLAAGAIGGGVAAGLGYTIAVIWNLVPLWTVPAVFLIGIAFLVLNWASGRGGS